MKSLFDDHPGLRSNPNGAFDELKSQLLVAMARKLAGPDGGFAIPASMVDENGQYMLTMEADSVGRNFIFTVSKKS